MGFFKASQEENGETWLHPWPPKSLYSARSHPVNPIATRGPSGGSNSKQPSHHELGLSPSAWLSLSASVHLRGLRSRGRYQVLWMRLSSCPSQRTQGPQFRACQQGARLPGTFPSECARVTSLSGKHRLPLLPDCRHHLCQLDSLGILGPMYDPETGHLGTDYP